MNEPQAALAALSALRKRVLSPIRATIAADLSVELRLVVEDLDGDGPTSPKVLAVLGNAASAKQWAGRLRRWVDLARDGTIQECVDGCCHLVVDELCGGAGDTAIHITDACGRPGPDKTWLLTLIKTFECGGN